MNCRSISEETWVKAHRRLVYYFSRGRGADRAEDLAQETLAAVWRRQDFEFEKEEDFLAVCLGFARNIGHENQRDIYKYSGVSETHELATPENSAESHSAAEFRVLFRQIMEAAKQLPDRDYELILKSIEEKDDVPEDAKEANRRRVSLHRAIRRLARLLNSEGRV